MNNASTVKKLLNASLILHGIYAVLFLACYFVQKPVWHIFGVTPEIEEMPAIIAPAVVAAVVATLAVSVWLNLALRKRAEQTASAVLGVLTAVFCIGGFLADRLVKAISCVYYAAVVGRIKGTDYVVLAGFHENSLQFLDTFLLIFLAAGLALLPCAYCVMRFGAKDNNYLKG